MVAGPRMIGLALQHLEKHGREVGPLRVLASVTVCEGLPLARNQELILEQLTSSPLRAAAVLPCQAQARVHIANCSQDPLVSLHTLGEDEAVLAYETAFVSLLAACCVRHPRRRVGKHSVSTSICEAKCQQLLPVHEAVRCAKEASTPQCLRVSALRYLTWVYLMSDEALRDRATTDLLYELVSEMGQWTDDLEQDLDVAQAPHAPHAPQAALCSPI